MQVHQLKVGASARILSLQGGEPSYRQRLVAMGLIPGTVFTLLRVAPLGDPIQIQVRGFALSLRKNEASLLRIQRVE